MEILIHCSVFDFISSLRNNKTCCISLDTCQLHELAIGAQYLYTRISFGFSWERGSILLYDCAECESYSYTILWLKYIWESRGFMTIFSKK